MLLNLGNVVVKYSSGGTEGLKPGMWEYMAIPECDEVKVCRQLRELGVRAEFCIPEAEIKSLKNIIAERMEDFEKLGSKNIDNGMRMPAIILMAVYVQDIMKYDDLLDIFELTGAKAVTQKYYADGREPGYPNESPLELHDGYKPEYIESAIEKRRNERAASIRERGIGATRMKRWRVCQRVCWTDLNRENRNGAVWWMRKQQVH